MSQAHPKTSRNTNQKDQKTDQKQFIVTQKRSKIGCTKSQIATLQAMGLKGRHKSVVMSDNPANRGQIMKVQHLVEVAVKTQ